MGDVAMAVNQAKLTLAHLPSLLDELGQYAIEEGAERNG